MPSFIIDDSTSPDLLFPASHSRGYVERDFRIDPVEMFANPSDMKLIDKSEWSARIKERKEQKSGLRDIRKTMANGAKHKSLDQNGQGYCWAYSIGSVIMFARGKNNLPYQRLSPHAVACKIKNFQDQGGWCGLSAKFARETGYPTEQFWPQKSMARGNDNAATWADAAKHKITNDWVDLAKPVYDQNLTFGQVVTRLLNNDPVAVDFNWWGHSVCAIDVDEVEPGSFALVIINSWTDQWGDEGEGLLRGNKALPDGAVAVSSVTVAL